MEDITIYLIRHSEQYRNFDYAYTSYDEYENNKKIVLSIDGEKKAKKLAKRKELKNIEMLYSSDYARAISTAKYIAEKNNLTINIDERFGERKIGIVDEALKKDKSLTVMQLLDENFKNQFGESNVEVRQRMKEAVLSIISKCDAKNLAIVSHGAAIKYFLQEVCLYDDKHDCLIFNDQQVCPRKLESPSIVKIVCSKDCEIKEIQYIE